VREVSLTIGLIFRSVAVLTIAFFSVILPASTAAQTPDKSLVTLNQCWNYPTENLVLQRPAVDNSNLYFGERGGRITAISLSTGTRLWSTELGGELRSNIAFLGSNLYVVAGPTIDGGPKGNGRLRVLSTNTGIPNPETELPFSGRVRLVTIAMRLVAISDGGNVMAFDGSSASPAWQRTFPSIYPETVTVWSDKIAFAASDNRVYVISGVSGANVTFANTDRPVSALGIIDDDLVWGDDRGNLVRYDLAKNSVDWRFKNGARISSIAAIPEGVVATSNDNFAYLVSSDYGSVKWKKRLSGRISNFTVGDGAIAVAETVGDPNAVVLNLDNGKSVGQAAIVDDEAYILASIYTAGKFIFFTNRRVIARSAAQCAAK
jgi:outer membrane protein assembly factor BamB